MRPRRLGFFTRLLDQRYRLATEQIAQAERSSGARVKSALANSIILRCGANHARGSAPAEVNQ
jgi:hypothetical protein